MAATQESKLAKRLARLIVAAGDEGVAQTRPTLEKLLSGRPAADRKAFLRAFHKAAEREVRRDSLLIESAQPLDDEAAGALVDHFNDNGTRRLFVTRQVNPELIGGVRCRIGDTVYDASVAGNLRSLSARLR